MSTSAIPTHFHTITDSNLEEFKKLVRKAVFLTQEEDAFFRQVPNALWKMIFAKNFDGNYEYAKRLLLNKHDEIERIDTKEVDREKQKIHNLEKATGLILQALEKKEPLLFITDFDNDGSLAQAIIAECLKMDPQLQAISTVEYSQSVGGNANRGLTLEHVELIVQQKIEQGALQSSKDAFTIITADNGINSREEQHRIHKAYPNATIIITDHHNPDPQMVIEENPKAVIFNPHFKPTHFFQKYNISGASTVGVLLKNVLSKRMSGPLTEEQSKRFEKIATLFKVSNLLDYVDTHPADKPEKDFIISKFLQLQPLMNINNSISKIITGQIDAKTLEALEKKIPRLNHALLQQEADHIHKQNHVAKVLLHIYKNQHTFMSHSGASTLTKEDFDIIFLQELTRPEHFEDQSNINPNYIEQLRPIIFGLGADYNKTPFEDSIEEKMVAVFEAIKESEKKMGAELRRGEVITKERLPNSSLAYADEYVLRVFNRKFLNKVYNDENPGFAVTLDSVRPEKVSGSFRSLYDISDILRNKAQIERKLGVKIETPGHERAAGFIIKSKNPKKNPITPQTLKELNEFINESIEYIRAREVAQNQEFLLTDLSAIHLFDRINTVIRGNVSNFEKISPLLKLDENTVWTDSYTTEQFTMQQICDQKHYGYISINTNFDGGTVIVPVELVRRIVENDYKDYLSLGYMDGGVFMAEKVVPEKSVKKVIDLRMGSYKTKALEDAFEMDFKHSNIVDLTREQIADNPFFKYHDYGRLHFDLFERMVIGIIDTNRVDMLAVFDVEANGFGNSKLMNIGSMNYTINPDSGKHISANAFYAQLFHNMRGEEYLLNNDQIQGLQPLSAQDLEQLPLEQRKLVLFKNNALQAAASTTQQETDDNDNSETIEYFIPANALELLKKKKKQPPYEQIKNYIQTPDGTVIYNRELQAQMIAYLVKDDDFKVPQEMVNLTGITQDLLQRYGKYTHEVDAGLASYYKGKRVLFGAHNTPYDARVSRANLPEFYDILRSSKIYDSTIFSKSQRLAYDDVQVAKLPQIEAISKNIFFYNNTLSDFNLTSFIEQDQNGYYPDRTNSYLLEIDNGQYYLVDKVRHEKVKIEATKEELLSSIMTTQLPGNLTKYSVEKLSEQWMIHSLLLCNETFDIQHVTIDEQHYPSLVEHQSALKFFQENYHFDSSLEENLLNFITHYPEIDVKDEDFAAFAKEFLFLNKDIVQKFSDAWMYKMVLEIKDPSRLEVTNDLVDLVNYQTSIPKDKIRKIFEDAIVFKEKYNLKQILQHEVHANGPWRTDVKGDIAFEDKLTFALFATRRYNPYNHSIKHAIEEFNDTQIRAKVNFDISDRLSLDVAHDSYSFRQALQYDRSSSTMLVQKIQDKESALSDDSTSSVIKFKLDNDILPPDTAVYALSKKGAILDRELIEEHKKMLGFILLNEQLQSSVQNAPSKVQDILKQVYEANQPLCLQYKEQLSEHYAYLEYNKKGYQIKEFLEKAKGVILDGESLPKRGQNKAILPNADISEVKNVKAIVQKMISATRTLKAVDSQQCATLLDKLDERLQDPSAQSKMEMVSAALAKDPSIGFMSASTLKDPMFLETVDIVRKTPLSRILHMHPEFRILNALIDQQQCTLQSTPPSPSAVKP